MGISFKVGPAIDVSQRARELGKDVDKFLFEDCGLPYINEYEQLLAEYEEGILPDDYLDSIFYDFCEKLSSTFGETGLFSYHEAPGSYHWIVYCDARDAWENGISLENATNALRNAFDSDSKIFWLEATSW